MSYIETLTFEFEIIAKFILALLLGFFIGLEREYNGKPAGMRTYSLVAASSSVLVILGISITDLFEQNFQSAIINSDPTRIIQAIIVGISFLGAGSILKNKKDKTIENLTTAAGILAAAAVGISVALSHFYAAIVLTATIIIINKALLYIEQWLDKQLEKVKEHDSTSQ